jgi:hypothetical protein
MFIDLDTRSRIRTLINDSDNPTRVEKVTVEAMRAKLRYTKKCVTLDKLKTLKKMRIGTTIIEQIAKKVEGEDSKRRKETVVYIVDRQTSNVTKLVKELKQISFQRSKEMLRELSGEWRKDEARKILRVQADREWKRGKERVKNSTEFLKKKFGSRDAREMTVPESDRQIGEEEGEEPIGDENDMRVEISRDLTENEMNEMKKEEKAVTEGIEIDEDEEAYLNIPKSLADHADLDEIKTMNDINIMGDKIRWSLREEEEKRKKNEGKQAMSREEEEEETEKEAKLKRIVDEEAKTVEFAKKRVTSMKSCTRITLPQTLGGATEAKIDTLVGGLTDAVRREAKRRKGVRNKSVYTESELRGKEKIKKREKAGELVVVSTDKSGKRAGLETERYRQKVAAHTIGDTIVTVAEVDKIETDMSALAQSVARSLRIGENWGHTSRVKQACKTKFSKVPTLDIMLKDHKGGDNLPARPVCRSSNSPNGVLGDIVSDYLEILANEKAAENGTEVRSTEEMCAKLVKVNDRIRAEKRARGDRSEDEEDEVEKVIGSMDVAALYPSIDIERSMKIIEKNIIESKLDVDVSVSDMNNHIVSTHSQSEIDEKGLSDVCSRRRSNRGTRPGITGAMMTGTDKERDECQSWDPPVREPNSIEKKKMLAMVICQSASFVMTNHVYSTEDVIRKQSKGGAIGLRMTGEIARIVMLEFDSILRARLAALGIEEWTYGRYVDDTNTVVTVLPVGTRYNPITKELEVTEEATESDKELEDDSRTFSVIQKVANDIWPEIQWTVDVPSNHDHKRMPMLDMQVGMEGGEVVYEFFEKKMNTPYCIPARSAHSWSTKRSTLVQEGVRRMLNTSRNSSVMVRKEIMEKWDLKLRYSGYSYKFREAVISAALGIYKCKLMEDSKEGGRPLYRNAEYKKEERRKEKEKKSVTWYRGKGEVPNLAPLIVDPTEGGQLKKELARICNLFKETHNIGVLLMERGGQKSSSDIRSNPLGTKLCKRENCPICREENSKGGCQGGGVGYEHQCNTCLTETGKITLYHGESSKSGYERGLQHADGLRKEKEDNVMWKHSAIHHGGVHAKFTMKITGRFAKCLERQEDEGTRVRESKADILMNSMTQWHQPPIKRVVVMRGNVNQDQIGAELLEAGGQNSRTAGRGARGQVRGRGRGRTAR